MCTVTDTELINPIILYINHLEILYLSWTRTLSVCECVYKIVKWWVYMRSKNSWEIFLIINYNKLMFVMPFRVLVHTRRVYLREKKKIENWDKNVKCARCVRIKWNSYNRKSEWSMRKKKRDEILYVLTSNLIKCDINWKHCE